MKQTFNNWRHSKSLFFAESITATNNFMIKQSFLQILQYNIRKSLKIQKSFLINREVRDFNIVIIQKQSCNINDTQSFNSAHNFFYLVKNTSSQLRTCIYVNKYLRLNQWMIETAELNICLIRILTYNIDNKTQMLQLVKIVPRSFNQRNSRLICMYCSLEVAITRH